MPISLHSIELEKNGNVFATFRNENEYDEYLGNNAVDYYDGDFDMTDDYKVWYCVFKNGQIISIDEKTYLSRKDK